MAPRQEQPLHHDAVHVGRRVGAAILTAALLAASIAVAYESRNPAHLAGLLLPAVVFALSWPTIWRSSRIFASDLGLRIESGGESRFVPWQSVTGVAVPFWVINPLAWFESRTITLRDGTRVLFFPAPGAVALVNARVLAERGTPDRSPA
jgi:hypothetical protein